MPPYFLQSKPLRILFFKQYISPTPSIHPLLTFFHTISPHPQEALSHQNRVPSLLNCVDERFIPLIPLIETRNVILLWYLYFLFPNPVLWKLIILPHMTSSALSSPHYRCFQSRGSERMVPQPRNLLETQISWSHPRPTETETLGVGPSNVCFNIPSGWSPSMVKLESGCSTALPSYPWLNTFLIQNSCYFVTTSFTSPGQGHWPFSQSVIHIQGLHLNSLVMLILSNFSV